MATSMRTGSSQLLSHGDEEGEEEYEEEYEEEEVDYAAKEDLSNHALNLKWCIGFNYKLVNGVINLTIENRKEIFFVSGHTGVIYNYEEKMQRLLQGHCNEISCCIYCPKRDIIVTCDKGPSSLMVIWDVTTGTPIKSIFDPHEHGVQSVDITEDGSVIVTLSREEAETGRPGNQHVSLWLWEQDDPLVSTTELIMKPTHYDYQRYVQINKWKSRIEEFATTGKESVYFWEVEPMKNYECTYYTPPNNSMSKREKGKLEKEKANPKKQKDDKKKLNAPSAKEAKAEPVPKKKPVEKGVHPTKKQKKEGRNDGLNHRTFTQTVFIPGSTQAVTGTDSGLLVVWDISLSLEDMGEPDQRREIKSINLLNVTGKNDQEKIGISVLKASPALLIIGATNGHIRFYDYQFRIVGWFEDNPSIGEITSISLSNEAFPFESLPKSHQEDEHYFKYPNFIVVDKNARIVLMETELFKLPRENPAKAGKTLLESIPSRVTSLSSKPNSSKIAFACDNGIIYEWDFAKKESALTKLKEFDRKSSEKPTCLQYSPDGRYLIVASSQRNVYCTVADKTEWQTNVLTISQKKNYIKGVYIAFSENSSDFAIMDDHSCVSLYKLEKEGSGEEWIFNGKSKSHFTEVNDICFGETLEGQEMKRHKLFSIGEDRFMFQYDVAQSRKNELAIDSITKIDHEGIPTACLWYPVNYLKEDVLMVAYSDYKIRLWNVKDKQKKFCKATLLGPTYGGPINKMIYLNIHNRAEEESSKYVAYSTKEKIVGIIKLPLDGNPNKTMGMIAHPNKISSMTATNDGKFLFTCGSDEIGIINMWYVNYSTLEEQVLISKTEKTPLDTYPNLLEGGKEGPIYRDLKDFFYFSQINSSTENPTKAKKLDGKIPREDVQNLMRALGYYPTKLEIENMQNEVLYSQMLQTGKHEDSLVLDTFVRLFINHRPVYGLTTNLIKEKLKVLETEYIQDPDYPNDPNKVIAKQVPLSRDTFLNYMKHRGEKISEENLRRYMAILRGEGELNELLPESLNGEFLIKDLLGFEDEFEGEEEDEEVEFKPDYSN
jgi:WD40 repeat protein